MVFSKWSIKMLAYAGASFVPMVVPCNWMKHSPLNLNVLFLELFQVGRLQHQCLADLDYLLSHH